MQNKGMESDGSYGSVKERSDKDVAKESVDKESESFVELSFGVKASKELISESEGFDEATPAGRVSEHMPKDVEFWECRSKEYDEFGYF